MRKLSLLLIIIITVCCKQNQTENLNINTSVFDNKKNAKVKKQIELKLINIESKKGINLLDSLNIKIVLKTFGEPIQIENENKIDYEDGAEPWTTIKYDGLIIEFIGENISDITIDKKQWRISNIEIGKTDFEIEKYIKKTKRKNYNYSIFEIPNFDGVIFTEVNKEGRIIKFGISSSQC